MKEISLTRGRVALVDDEDYERLNQYNWNYQSTGYARRCNPGAAKNYYYMHREVLNLPQDRIPIIDHINGNKLDNRKCNLRVCTPRQNTANCSRSLRRSKAGFKGVYRGRKDYWVARIVIQSNHKTPEDAARAYDQMATAMHGEYAKLNFPKDKK